jgi:CheY-like chemotaxis protein
MRQMRGPAVLIVEDDWVIARDMKGLLEDAIDADVMVATSVDDALPALGQGLDFAILDVTVIGGDTFQFARRLAGIQIPFAFVTGSRRVDIPEDLQRAPFIAKPCSEDVLVGVVAASRRCAPKTDPGASSSALVEERPERSVDGGSGRTAEAYQWRVRARTSARSGFHAMAFGSLEAALSATLDLWKQRMTAIEIVGPNGVVISHSEIEAYHLAEQHRESRLYDNGTD